VVDRSYLVWGCHGGIALKDGSSAALDQLSVGIYLALGWAGLIATGPVSTVLALSTLVPLGAGGVVYSIGLVFHSGRVCAFRRPFGTASSAVCDGAVIAHTS
jgi:hemolysin III